MGRGAGHERRCERLNTVRASVLWAIAALGLMPVTGQAAEPVKAAPAAKPASTAPAKAADDEAALDEDLLEFLGTVDSEDEDWIDYLTQTDIEKVATTRRPKAAPDATEVKK